MRRLHLFELEDQPLLPAVLRDLLTDQLEHELCARGVHRSIVPRLGRAMARAGCSRIIDLCSGAGGLARAVRAALEARSGVPTTLVLTDLYPNRAAQERARRSAPDRIEVYGEPVDARAVPPDLEGFRTFFTSFHHFRPAEARAILEDAVERGAPIGVFEVTQRTARAPIAMLRAAARVWYRTPIDLEWTLPRLLFGCVLPIIPLVYYWDATVSHFRTYTPLELRAMVRGLRGPRYHWEIGREGGRGAQVTYLIGTPERR